jgi:predicted nucleic acid-binding protein
MIILDTSVWIEYLKAAPNYAAPVSRLLDQREVLAIACVFGELLQGAKSDRERRILSDYYKYLPKRQYEEAAIDAGVYSSVNRLIDKGVGLIDAMILQYALKSVAQVWTLDKKLLSVLPDELIYCA